MKIFKYHLDWYPGEQTLLVPQPALFLSAKVQQNKITLWFSVDPTTSQVERTLSQVERTFVKVGTGCEFDDTDLDHFITTLIYPNANGVLNDHVIHLFKKGE